MTTGGDDAREVGGGPQGRLVELTPLTAADAATLFRWINNRGDVLLNSPYRPVSERQHMQWFDGIQQQRDVVIFGIRLLTDGRLIGSCQLHGIHPVHRSAELQIRIGEAGERGRGHGTEAVTLLVDFAFRDLNLRRVALHVLATNERALKMYERIGFVREGVLREAAHVDGEYVDVVVLAILRADTAAR
jgi:diamine N-acetyltransferase